MNCSMCTQDLVNLTVSKSRKMYNDRAIGMGYVGGGRGWVADVHLWDYLAVLFISHSRGTYNVCSPRVSCLQTDGGKSG